MNKKIKLFNAIASITYTHYIKGIPSIKKNMCWQEHTVD